MTIQTINPSTEEPIQHYSLYSEEKIIELIEAGHACYQRWRKTDLNLRKQHMLRLAALLRLNGDIYAKLMACEMGKPLEAGHAEILKCAWVCEHYAENAERYLRPREIQTDHAKSKVCYEPLGIVFAVMPWNFPFLSVMEYVHHIGSMIILFVGRQDQPTNATGIHIICGIILHNFGG